MQIFDVMTGNVKEPKETDASYNAESTRHGLSMLKCRITIKSVVDEALLLVGNCDTAKQM